MKVDEQYAEIDKAINQAMSEIIAGIGAAHDKQYAHGTAILVGMAVGALQSISLSLQQLVAQGERDFSAAVKAEAEAMTAPMVEKEIEKQSKRSFIGMPKNSG